MKAESQDRKEKEEIEAAHQQREMEPDVECHKCGKLLHISEVQDVRREGIEPEAVPRYFCKSCVEELQKEGDIENPKLYKYLLLDRGTVVSHTNDNHKATEWARRGARYGYINTLED